MMAAPAKFLFDSDFGPQSPDAPQSITPEIHQAELEAAEARGYSKGMNAAEVQVRTELERQRTEAERQRTEAEQQRASAERQLAVAFERIASAIESLRNSLKTVEDRFEAESVEVAFAVGKKLAPELIAAEPFTEIEALAKACFQELLNAPHIVVRVNNSLYASARQKLEEIARTCGFEGRLVVMAENDIKVGDCRIEWADGGLVRDRSVTETAISEAVGRYVAARRGTIELPLDFGRSKP